MKTLDPDYLRPEQFSKMAESSDDFACACVEFLFQLGHPFCLRLRLHRKLKPGLEDFMLALVLLAKTRHNH